MSALIGLGAYALYRNRTASPRTPTQYDNASNSQVGREGRFLKANDTDEKNTSERDAAPTSDGNPTANTNEAGAATDTAHVAEAKIRKLNALERDQRNNFYREFIEKVEDVGQVQLLAKMIHLSDYKSDAASIEADVRKALKDVNAGDASPLDLSKEINKFAELPPNEVQPALKQHFEGVAETLNRPLEALWFEKMHKPTLSPEHLEYARAQAKIHGIHI